MELVMQRIDKLESVIEFERIRADALEEKLGKVIREKNRLARENWNLRSKLGNVRSQKAE